MKNLEQLLQSVIEEEAKLPAQEKEGDARVKELTLRTLRHYLAMGWLKNQSKEGRQLMFSPEDVQRVIDIRKSLRKGVPPSVLTAVNWLTSSGGLHENFQEGLDQLNLKSKKMRDQTAWMMQSYQSYQKTAEPEIQSEKTSLKSSGESLAIQGASSSLNHWKPHLAVKEESFKSAQEQMDGLITSKVEPPKWTVNGNQECKTGSPFNSLNVKSIKSLNHVEIARSMDPKELNQKDLTTWNGLREQWMDEVRKEIMQWTSPDDLERRWDALKEKMKNLEGIKPKRNGPK